MKQFHELKAGEQFLLDSSQPYTRVVIEDDPGLFVYYVPPTARVRTIDPYARVKTRRVVETEVWE